MAIIEHDFNFSIRDINYKLELTNTAILRFFEDIAGYHSDMVGYGLKNIENTRIKLDITLLEN